MKKIIFAIFVIILLLLFPIILISKDYEEDNINVLGYGTIEAREIRVGSKLGGRIEEVHVDEGYIVEKEEKLVTLDSRELEAKKEEAEASLLSAKATLDELIKGYRPEIILKAKAVVKEQEEYLGKLITGARKEEIESQEAQMNASLAEYTYTKKNYERLIEQVKEGAIAEEKRDEAQKLLDISKEKYFAQKKNYELLKSGSRKEDINIAQARLLQAKADLSQMEKGPRQEELDRAKSFVKECEARLKLIKVQLEEKYILAPSKSIVDVCNLEPGDIIVAGQPAIILLNPYDLWVKIYIKENQLYKIKLNQKVEIFFETKNQREFKSWFLTKLFSFFTEPEQIYKFEGNIANIASKGEFTPRNVQTVEERGHQVFAVKVNIKNKDNFLRPGMTVVAKEIKIER